MEMPAAPSDPRSPEPHGRPRRPRTVRAQHLRLGLVHDVRAERLDGDCPADPGRGFPRLFGRRRLFRARGPQSVTPEEASHFVRAQPSVVSAAERCREDGVRLVRPGIVEGVDGSHRPLAPSAVRCRARHRDRRLFRKRERRDAGPGLLKLRREPFRGQPGRRHGDPPVERVDPLGDRLTDLAGPRRLAVGCRSRSWRRLRGRRPRSRSCVDSPRPSRRRSCPRGSPRWPRRRGTIAGTPWSAPRAP